MNKKIDFQDWELTSGSGEKQSQPHSPMHTLVLCLWVLMGAVLCALGLVLIFNPNISEETRGLAITAVMAVTGIIYVFAVATRTTKHRKRTLIFGLLLIIGALVLYFLTDAVVFTFRIATGVIGIAVSLFMFLNVWREHVDGVPWFGSLLWGIVYGVLSVAILFSPDGTRLLAVITGLYLIMLAGNVLFSAFSAMFYNKPHLKQKFVVTLPMSVAACLPMALFREVNTMVKEEPDEVLFLQSANTGEEPDLIVYIHTRAGLIPGFGHCDLCYDGKVYSYGDYDEATWKAGGFLADGVLGKVDPESHIKMALKDDKKILMAYGIQLTPELKEKVEGQLDKIMSQAYRWKPKAELATEGQLDGDPNSFDDVGSKMFLEEGAELYKFKEGSKYKTYYALGENCSEVVNDVVGNTGIRLFKLNGIVTPGSYLEYLDQLYETDNSIVTDRRLYMLDVDGKPVEYPLNPKQAVNLGELSQ